MPGALIRRGAIGALASDPDKLDRCLEKHEPGFRQSSGDARRLILSQIR
jgi:hypothetical protein